MIYGQQIGFDNERTLLQFDIADITCFTQCFIPYSGVGSDFKWLFPIGW
jgi:hypothetical protein